jgi:hypothetical protein
MKLHTKQDVLKLVKTLNAEITISKQRALDVMVDAPNGYVWKSTYTHCIVINYYSEFNELWNELYKDLIQGIDKCTDKNCEICEP